jgi:hypothetical protein
MEPKKKKKKEIPTCNLCCILSEASACTYEFLSGKKNQGNLVIL